MMKATKISATDLRIKVRDVLERVRFKDERFIVQNFGRPVAVILSVEDYTALVKSAPTIPSDLADKRPTEVRPPAVNAAPDPVLAEI
jgi:prevent-host-death family protein